MADKSAAAEMKPDSPAAAAPASAPDAAATTPAPAPPRRSPGHRGADVKDTVAEMAAKAHEISLEAGSKMAAAMKDVINAAAGLTGFVVESARDLVQYMVRRGQMTQEEADKLIRQAEEANAARGGTPAAKREESARTTPPARTPEPGEDEPSAPSAAPRPTRAAKPAPSHTQPDMPHPPAAAARPATRTAPKSATKPAGKSAAKSGAHADAKPATRSAPRAAKSAPKGAAKKAATKRR